MATTLFNQILFAEQSVVSFERFMTVALHDEQVGYYPRQSRIAGKTGDFATSTTLHPMLGRAIVNWLRALPQWQSRSVDLIEVGAGNGALARTIISSLPWWQRRKVHYHIVESSRALTKTQQSFLKKYHVQWHDSLRDAAASAGTQPIIFSNELVDAFPCKLLEKTTTGWAEVCLTKKDTELDTEALREVLVDLSPAALEALQASVLSSSDWLCGQRIEVHSCYQDWLQQGLAQVERATLLTIDYGDVAGELYLRRRHGTLRGYCKHMRMEGTEIFQRPGHQDLTADVNFTDLQLWGEALGLRSRSLTTQREFLHRFAPRDCARAASDPVVAGLLHPDGAGGAFKVLWQELGEAGR